MLRCRKCRRCIVDSTSMSMVDNIDESSAAVCNIWHINMDTLPGWILTSVHRAQWTVGKLNCQFCSSRLGSFNFVSHTECPCGRDATVHLNKSRVDLDLEQRVLIFQPRRSRLRMEQAHESGCKDESPEMQRTRQQNGGSSSGRSPAVASNALADGETDVSFSFSPLYCISPQRRRSAEDVSSVGPSCFCPAGVAQFSRSPASPPGPTDAEASVNDVACLGFVPRRLRLPPPLEPVVNAESAVETQVHSDSAAPPGGRPINDGAPVQIEEVTTEASPGTQASNTGGLNKKEKNRLKGLRRKQRRRKRWLELQKEGRRELLLEEEEEQGDTEGLTCPVCLEVFFSPHSCQPCGHIFCEPCLRTVAKHRAVNTPCPLCRSLILHTSYEEELAKTVQEVFPMIYCARKQSFQKAATSKWPLPQFKKHSPWWASVRPRRTLRSLGNWHFVHHGGFMLNMMDLSNVRVWCFDTLLLLLYIHSSNWLMSLFFLAVVFYFFAF